MEQNRRTEIHLRLTICDLRLTIYDLRFTIYVHGDDSGRVAIGTFVLVVDASVLIKAPTRRTERNRETGTSRKSRLTQPERKLQRV